MAGCSLFPPPRVTTPDDTSPHNLDVNIDVVEGSATHPATQIDFLFVYNDVPVRFVHDEQVTCNGAALSFSDNEFSSDTVPAAAPGGGYTCVYNSSGGQAQVFLPAVAAPVFISPKQGATVAREKTFVITYEAGNGTSIQASASGAPFTPAAGNQQQGDSGSIGGIDTTSLSSGPGSIILDRERDTQLPSAFHKAMLHSGASTQIAVTWS